MHCPELVSPASETPDERRNEGMSVTIAAIELTPGLEDDEWGEAQADDLDIQVVKRLCGRDLCHGSLPSPPPETIQLSAASRRLLHGQLLDKNQ
ncbi:hypothetical protein UPYG_G00126470 [Umbra pygmaea]|uniref:Uncharacterized protein n=1 Tax=Umbra pygmaea TaxID=75934 RepID=A0ABD0XR85_UMBPY